MSPLRLAAVVIAAALMSTGCSGDGSNTGGVTGAVRTVSLDEVRAAVDSDRPPLLLDVRTPGEFAQGSLPDAVSMPEYRLELDIGKLDRDRPIVVYCEVGVRAERVARVLVARGFTDVSLYRGGMREWRRAVN